MLPTVMPSMMPSVAPSVTSVAFNERFGSLEQRIAGLEASISGLAMGIESFTMAAQRREEAVSNIEQTIDARFKALASFVHTALADFEHNLAERVDIAERRVTTTLRESASDTVSRVRDVSGRVSEARRGLESTVRDEVATVLLGMRAGLTPLTNEVVARVGAVERGVEIELETTMSKLRDDMALLFDAVASLQRDLSVETEHAADSRS